MISKTGLSLITSVSALAMASFPGVASAQDAPTTEQCATIADEAQKQACLDRADSVDPTSQEGDPATLPPGAAPANEQQGVIVVTGSRIRRSEFNSPDPIQIINPELGAQQGQSETAELLLSSPVAQGSIQITSAISTNFVTNGGADAQTIGLRGLGPERTLVLLNGRRAGPAGVRGAITSFDLNVIPVSVVRSVEILKTGASSIYGSDAIAGVVNILTKRDTDGLELRGFVSAPVKSGGEVYSVSASYGKEFSRGHFLVTADYFRRQDLQVNDRDFLGCQEEFLTFQQGDRADIIDQRTGQPACSGVLNNAVLTNNDFTGPGFSPGLTSPGGGQAFVSQFAVGTELNGACFPINGRRPGVVAPANFFGCNFDGPSTGVLNTFSELEKRTDIQSDLKRYTLFADASFEITDGIEAYTELLYNKRKTFTDGIGQINAFLFTGSSILPAFFCAPTVDFNCRTTDAGDPFNSEFRGNFLLRPLIVHEADSGTDIDYYRGVVGLRGDIKSLLSGWSYDIHGQYSRSDGEYFQDIALADALFTQDFRTRSCVGLVTPVTGTPCIDIDFLDPRVLRGDFNAAERAFLFTRDVGRTIYEQTSGEAILTGDLITLPAGGVGTAIGVQIRRDEIVDTPGQASIDGNVFARSSGGVTAGKTVSKEVFGEIQIPLIHNTPGIERFAVSGAARYTSVDATRGDGVKDSFSDTTWKVGADWQATDWLRFRGSYGTSFRAPALFELFLENQTGFQRQQDIDVCINTAVALARGTINQRIFDNCAAAGIPDNFAGATGGALITSGGGIGTIEPETSTAKSFSVILTPQGWFWDGMRFSLAIDYFDIKVKDEITTLGARNIIVGCYNSEFFPDDPLCDQIVRSSSGPNALNITDVRDTFINVNNQRNRGYDVTARAVQDLGSWGTLTLLAQATRQLQDDIELFEGTVVELNGENGDPKWVADLNATWNKGPWSVLYGIDIIGRTSDLGDLRAEQGAALDQNDCRTSLFRPGVPPAEAALGARRKFCPDVVLATTFYHNASVTRRIGDDFTFTVGMANIFDTRPPRASTVFNGGISTIGQAPAFGSQYDYFGRRMFVNVRANF